jgi:hypothetical protein
VAERLAFLTSKARSMLACVLSNCNRVKLTSCCLVSIKKGVGLGSGGRVRGRVWLRVRVRVRVWLRVRVSLHLSFAVVLV